MFTGQRFSSWPQILCEFSHKVRPESEPIEVVYSVLLSDTERACSIPESLHHLKETDLQVRLAHPQSLSTVYYLDVIPRGINTTVAGNLVDGGLGNGVICFLRVSGKFLSCQSQVCRVRVRSVYSYSILHHSVGGEKGGR